MGNKNYFAKKNSDSKSKKNYFSGTGAKRAIENDYYKVGYDTFESDLQSTAKTLETIGSQWHSQEDMDSAKTNVKSMYDRLGRYQQQYEKYGGVDLSELYNAYGSALDNWDAQTEYYGYYKNADAYNNAVKQRQFDEQFKGLSYEDVQTKLSEYSPDSDEYKYLNSYTGYSSIEDFEKALESSETIQGFLSEINGLKNRKKTFEYRSRGLNSDGGYGKKIEDKEAELDAYLKSAGYDSLSDYEQQSGYFKDLSKAKNKYLLENGHIDKYKHVAENEDFEETSQYIPTGYYDALKDVDMSKANGLGEMAGIYEFINNKDARDLMVAMSGMAGQNNPYSDLGYDLLTEDEKKIFNSLYKADEANGTNEAKQFLKDMKIALQKRASDQQKVQNEKLLENPLIATAFSAVSPVATLAGGIANILESGIDLATGREYNPYSSMREISNTNTHGREVVGSNIAEATEGFELFGQNIPSFLYNTGMSVLDTTVGGYGIGPAYTFLMGANAYQDKAKELTEAGEDASTVQGLAIVSGALEVAFEYIGFDNLMKLKDADSVGKIFYNALVSQGGAEGMEEFGTSLGNMWADYSFRGKDSEYMKMHSDLLARGFSEKEANTEVAKAIGSELFWSYVGGHLSGTGLGGTQSVAQYAGNVATGKAIKGAEQTANVFDAASLSPEESQAYELYTRYANKGVTAENATKAQIGNLYNTVNNESGFEYKKASAEKNYLRRSFAELNNNELEATTAKQKAKATKTLDTALSRYADARSNVAKYEASNAKLTEVQKGVYDKIEADAEVKHKEEVKKKIAKLSSGVETSVIAKTDKAVEIKGLKDENTLITSEGEVALKDVNLSDKDAELVYFAKTIEKENPKLSSLFVEQYDGKTDFEQYANDFGRVAYYAQHNGFTQQYILEHKGSLSTEQVNAIYSNTVAAEARQKEEEHNKLISATASGTPYRGYVDDSIFRTGKVKYSTLSARQKKAVEFLKVFATKSGMNLVFTPYSDKTNGAFSVKKNTIYVSVGAGINSARGMLNDTIIPTASHEVTHWMKEKSPELYLKLKEKVFEALKEANPKLTEADRIAYEIARLDKQHKGKKHTAEDATDEIVARACEDMLAMSKEGRKMFASMSEEEQKTFIGKVKEIIENLKKWIDDFLASYGTQTEEAKALRNFKDKLEEMSEIWDQMLVRSIEVNQALEKANVFDHLKNGVSEDGTTIVGKNNLQMSDKTYREGGRDFLVNWLNTQEGLSKKDKKNIIEQTDRVAALMRSIDEGGELPDYSNWANMEVVKDENGEKVLSVIVKNGDYAMNIDFSQVCKKRVALDHVLNAMVQQGVLDVISLSESDMSELNAVIKEHDFEIACALCFVDAKRYRVNAWADSFCEGSDEKKSGKTVHKYGFNEMVRSLIPKGSNLNVDEFNFTNRDIKNQPTKNLLSEADDSALDFSLIDKIMTENDSKSAQYRYAKAIKENPEIRKILNSAEIISSLGLDTIRLESPKLYGLINGHQGTAKPKFSHSMVAYGNDVLKAKNFTAESAKMVGGVRCQSFSDFMASMVVDYAQFISELAAKQLTSHSYTKEPLFVKLFGLTGMKINMSLVPKAVDMTPEQQKRFAILKEKNASKRSKEYKEALAEYEKLAENAGLDENGNYIWEDETFPYDIAMEIVEDRRYSKNCGTIAVGISNNHIRKLLADDRISMVIPYHKSGLNHEVAMMRDIALYKDYTDVQNTRDKATGKKLDKDKGQTDFDFYGDLYGKDGKEGTHDPKQTAQNYLKWCYENNYIPKFDDFMLDDNYYKLLIDFRVYDVDGTYVEQQPVQAIYPSNEEFNDLIVNGVKDKDGKVYGGLKQQQETSDRLDAETQQIINEYKERLRKKHGYDRLMKFSEKITVNNSDDRRTKILSKKSIIAPIYEGQADSAIESEASKLNSGKIGLVKSAIVSIGEQFEIYGESIRIEDVDVEITISKSNLKESVSKKATPTELAKLLPILNESVKNAIGIECHDNRYFYDSDTVFFENLLGGYVDGEYFVPVRFGLKHSISGKATLYVVVDQTKIPQNLLEQKNKTEVVNDTSSYEKKLMPPRSVEYSISQIIPYVKSKDVLRYIPDAMLDAEQKIAKWEAIAETIKDTAKKNDRKYAEFIANGKLQAAKEMVAQAAKKAGFTVKVYHGTHKFGFTKADVSKSDDLISFFATDSVETAGTYSGTDKTKRISEASNTSFDEEYGNVEEILKSTVSDFADFCNRTLGIRGWIDYDYIDTSLNDCLNDLENGVSSKKVSEDFVAFCDDLFYSFIDIYYDNNYNEKEYSHEAFEASEEYEKLADDYYSYVNTITAKFAVLDMSNNSGIYELYSNTDGHLVVDGNGSLWNNIPLGEIEAEFDEWRIKEKGAKNGAYTKGNTRNIAEFAKAKGYTGVTFKNILDSGDGTYIEPSTVYIFFNPQEQVKSADLVTYDDNGNIIPLSERFNTEDDDLRYSDKNTESVYDLMGENKRLAEEKAKLTEDVSRLKELLKLEKTVTKGKYAKNSTLLSAASIVRKQAHSNYDKVTLARQIGTLYTDIFENPNMSDRDIVDRIKAIAADVVSEAKTEKQIDYFLKGLLGEIKNTRVSLDEKQIAEMEYRFGTNWRKRFFNRIIIDQDAISLDSKWKDWSDPDSPMSAFFDADVNSADQIGKLYDLVDTLREASERVIEYDYAEQVNSVAEDIWNQFWNIVPYETTADKYSKKIADLKSKHKQMMNDLRTKRDAREKEKLETQKTLDAMYHGRMMLEKDKEIAKQRLADDIHYGRLIHKLKVRKEQAVDKARELGRQKLAEHKESIEKKTRIQKITANALALNDMLVHPTKEKHINDALRGPVIELLNAIDFSSKQMLEKGEPTKKDFYFAKALAKVKNMMDDANNGKEGLADLYGHGLEDNIKDLVNSVEKIMDSIEGQTFTLNMMSVKDLQTLDLILKTVKASVNNVNKFHVANHAKGIANLSQETVAYLDQVGRDKIHDGVLGKVEKLLNWNNALPYYAFKRYGNGGQVIYEALMDGQDKLAFNAKQIIDFAAEAYTAKEVKEWDEEIHTFKVLLPVTKEAMEAEGYQPEYQTLQMTTSQLMAMYCLCKREQAKKHLFGGGIRVADFKAKKDIVSQPDGVVFTEDDVTRLLDTLTDRQREVADKLQEFLNTVCPEWGNEVSMARFGYRAFGEQNYFPIQSDKNNLAVEDETEKINSLFRLLNMSFTKAVDDNANNRIVISSIFDVFAQHTSDMAKYNAFALPVLDAFKWYNYKEKQELTNGTFKTKGVKQSMETAFGKDGQSYFTTFLKDINGQQEGDREQLSKEFMRKYKIASVASNLRVVALQPTSYLRASAVIDSKYLTKALVFKDKAMGSSIEKAKKYCGIALWKSLGYYDTNIQRGLEAQIKHNDKWMDKVTEKAMKGAEKADELTWGLLWNACELEIRETRKDLQVRSEEFYEAIGKRLREVIYASQVVDSVMTRSQMMRSTKMHDQIMTNFASEPTLSYNMLYDAYRDVAVDSRKMGKLKALQKNRGKLGRIALAYTATNAVAALIETLFDAFRDDDDDENILWLFIENFLSDMSITAKIPYIKEIHSLIKGYGLSRSELAWMESLYKATNDVVKVAQGNPNWMKLTKDSLKALSEMSGLPAYNVYRDGKALVETIDDFIN